MSCQFAVCILNISMSVSIVNNTMQGLKSSQGSVAYKLWHFRNDHVTYSSCYRSHALLLYTLCRTNHNLMKIDNNHIISYQEHNTKFIIITKRVIYYNKQFRIIIVVVIKIPFYLVCGCFVSRDLRLQKRKGLDSK